MKRAAVLSILALCGPALAHGGSSSPLVEAAMTVASPASIQNLRANTDAQIVLSFTQDGLALRECRCRVLLYQGVPTARQGPLRDFMLDALKDGTQQFVIHLAQPGRYTLVLDGHPPSYGVFESFRASYPLQIKP